jgi:hypothetical protein
LAARLPRRKKIAKDLVSLSERRVEPVDGAGGSITLKPCQTLVWISFTRRLQPDDDPAELLTAANRWPALLDMGHNHCFSISGEQTGLSDPEIASRLDPQRPLYVQDAHRNIYPIPRMLGDIWLHPNVRTWTHGPYRIALGQLGIACYTGVIPAGWPAQDRERATQLHKENRFPRGPHLPLFGIRALLEGRLKLEIDCDVTGGTASILAPVPSQHSIAPAKRESPPTPES